MNLVSPDSKGDKAIQLRKKIRVPRVVLVDTRWSAVVALLNQTVPQDIEMMDTISGRQPQPKKVYKKRGNYNVKHRDIRPSTIPAPEGTA